MFKNLTARAMVISLFLMMITGFILLFSEKLNTPKKEGRGPTVKYVFKDETYCEITVVTSDLPKDSVIKTVKRLCPDESELVLINEITVETIPSE